MLNCLQQTSKCENINESKTNQPVNVHVLARKYINIDFIVKIVNVKNNENLYSICKQFICMFLICISLYYTYFFYQFIQINIYYVAYV